MSFGAIVNNITSYFQDIADLHNLIVRYDNDLRITPKNNLWYNVSIEFDDSKQKEIGINSYRNTGNFIIEIYSPIKVGISSILNRIDIIVPFFTELIVNNMVKFQTPKIKNKERVDDNHQINIICPFYVDN